MQYRSRLRVHHFPSYAAHIVAYKQENTPVKYNCNITPEGIGGYRNFTWPLASWDSSNSPAWEILKLSIRVMYFCHYIPMHHTAKRKAFWEYILMIWNVWSTPRYRANRLEISYRGRCTYLCITVVHHHETHLKCDQKHIVYVFR